MRLVVLALVGVVGCIDTQSVQCEDGSTCPAGTSCRQVGDGLVCATAGQVSACTGLVDLDACDDPVAGNCHDGVCLPIACGNGRVDRGEACDDHNTVTGDGCAGDCQSNETCGNGVVDPLKLVGDVKTLNEECDDGNATTGDGCSSRCVAEALAWQQLRQENPAPENSPGMAYDSGRRRVVLFGGEQVVAGHDVFSNSVYEWNGAGWLGQTVPLSPIGRNDVAMAFDAARGVTVMYGGNLDDNDASLADMWTWDGNRWSVITAPTPPRRTYHGMVYDSARKVIVMFGGFVNAADANDTWEWDGTSWKQIATATAPAAREEFVMAYDPKRGVTVVAGGRNGVTSYNDTWEYDGAWHQMAAVLPAHLVHGAMAYDVIGQRLIAYGGDTVSASNVVARTLAYNGQSWTDLAITTPGPLFRQAMASDPINGTIVMFGGAVVNTSGSPQLNNTWIWNGSTWTKAIEPLLPTATALAAAAYDPIANREWMFGGEDAALTTGSELWSFDGALWKKQLAVGGPGARQNANAIYDAARHQTLVFGGTATYNGAPAVNDTWLWNGSTWRQATPTVSPPARVYATIGYDYKRKRVVLVGGWDASQVPFTDAWEWDGDWHPVAPPPTGRIAGVAMSDPALGLVFREGLQNNFAPSPAVAFDGTTWTMLDPDTVAVRFFATTSYEPLRQRTLMLGGVSNGGSAFNDLWEWDGHTMALRPVSQQPPARGGAISFQGANGADTMLFGGRSALDASGTQFTDLWRLRFDSQAPRENCDLDVDADGDGLRGCADPDCWERCTPTCPPGTTCDPAEPHCGDGICSAALENCRNCAVDCVCAVVCGDTFCDTGETKTSCPGDCP